MMETSRLTKHRHTLVATFLFFLTFLIYFCSENSVLLDSKWAIHVSSSIVNSGNINLDEFEQVVVDRNYSSVIRTKIKGHTLPFFPVGNSILIAPIVWIVEKTAQFPEQQTFYQYLQQTSPFDPYLVSLQHFAASLITALVVPVLYYIGRKQFDGKTAVIGVLVFAFGTSAYSTASRVLWQHGPSMLMLVITLALFIKGKNNPRAIQWAGLPLAFSFIIRPTNSIPILIFTLVVFIRHRKQLTGYFLSAMVIAVPFIWSNLRVYDYFLPPYYQPQRVGSSPYFFEALVGNLISPSRGLLVFSPIMIFAVFGIVAKFRRKDLTLLDGALAVIIGLHWILISSFGHWWGGDSYGPRFFTDMMPFATYFLLTGFSAISLPTPQRRFRQIGQGIFAVIALTSMTIHYIGANQPAITSWSSWPIGLDIHASVRLWDWQDLVFLRTLDDWPFSDMPSNIAFDLQAASTDEPFRFPMHNTAHDDYLWEIKLPSSLQIVKTAGIDYGYAESGVPTVIGEATLSAQAYQWLPITLNQPLDSFSDPSLGAIMVTAKTRLGEEKSVQVIPVSIVNNGRKWQESNAFNKQIWLPADIRINGGKADNTLYGYFGPGWYALETAAPYQWRWSQSPAELYVFSAEPRSLTLELSFNGLHNEASADGLGDTGQLHISVGEEIVSRPIKIGEIHQFPLTLEKGWNTLVFHLEAGNFSPADVDTASSDRRVLSFSLDAINLVTDSAADK